MVLAASLVSWIDVSEPLPTAPEPGASVTAIEAWL
jgi:hypothetical protein